MDEVEFHREPPSNLPVVFQMCTLALPPFMTWSV